MRETKLGKRLLPLVQLVPAAVVAVAVAVTLPRTVPVLAEIPARLAAAPEPAAVETTEEPEEEELTAKLPYADGVYVGSSRGYGGKVQVQVTMEGGRITDVQILSAKHETKAFLKRARRLLGMVVDAQSWEVDAVSEATYTSRGILGAVRNALTGEVVNNPLPPQPKPAEPLVEEVFETPSAYRDGVYTASADGFGGPITVQVTVSGDAITDIMVVSHDGETTSYFSKARRVISTILETGTPEGVDAVSGATYSSTGLLNAVKLALSKAANDAAPAEEPAETQPAQPEQPASSETEETTVVPPTVEVVQPAQPERPASLSDWLGSVWSAFFPAEEPASVPASSLPEFFAQPVEPAVGSAAEETQPDSVSEEQQTEETEEQTE